MGQQGKIVNMTPRVLKHTEIVHDAKNIIHNI